MEEPQQEQLVPVDVYVLKQHRDSHVSMGNSVELRLLAHLDKMTNLVLTVQQQLD